MKNTTRTLVSFAMVLTWGTLALSAQSCAVASHVSDAIGHSGAASKELLAAGVQSGAASVKVVSGVVAVPVFISGAALATTGSIVAGAGESVQLAGNTTSEGAHAIWDFATGDPAKRPPLNRDRAVPPGKKVTAREPSDPAPGEMLKAKR